MSWRFFIIFIFVICNHFDLSLQNKNEKEKSFSTSIPSMVNLLDIERQLISSVDAYADALQSKVLQLKALVAELKLENDKSITNPEQYLYNPLNGYALIRRMYHDWPNIELFMEKQVGEDSFATIQKYRTEMPTSTDLREASESIYRIQTTYDLKPDDILKGLLNGKQYDVSLKTIDQYFMGYFLFGDNFYYEAGFWLYPSILSYADSDYYKIVGFDKSKILELYALTLLKQDRPKDALNSIRQASGLHPEDARLLKLKLDIEQQSITNQGPPIAYPKEKPSNYKIGCRGGFRNLKPSQMYCIYNTTTQSFLRLAPLKMEIIHLDPYMVVFHDVLSDSEIAHLQQLAIPTLKRATVYHEKDSRSKVVNRRTSKFSWFGDFTDNVTIRLNQRIVDMTGFNLTGSEMLQVMNYGLGGHYDTHYDFFNVSDTADVVKTNGDRIATVLFYLNDVEQGGATVFPNLQTAVYPQKGSAVMWYNLNNKVEGDYRTLHAACPVIVGTKWVTNKWIRSKAQMFRRPCYI